MAFGEIDAFDKFVKQSEYFIGNEEDCILNRNQIYINHNPEL